MKYNCDVLLAATALLGVASALIPGPQVRKPGMKKSTQITKRQLPADAVGVQTIKGPSGINITYKDPGAEVRSSRSLKVYVDKNRVSVRQRPVSNLMQDL